MLSHATFPVDVKKNYIFLFFKLTLGFIHNSIYKKSVDGGGHEYIYTPLVLLFQDNPGLMQAAFFQFEVVDERHCGVFVVEDVKVVVEGHLREDLLLVLGRTLEDVGEALASPLELLRAHDLAPPLGRLGRRGGDLVTRNRLARPGARDQLLGRET